MAGFQEHDSPRSKNILLAGLPQYDYDHLEPYLKEISLSFKEVLHEQDEPVRKIIFPGHGVVCSLLKNMADGRVAEIATVGREGAVGTGVFGDRPDSPIEAIVQVTDGGGGYSMPVEAFREEMDQRGAFNRAVMRFSQALLCQISQTAVCNALHTHEERGCRWLLMTHDRAGRDSFQLTDDLLGAMIGVRRPSVTLVAQALQNAGFIDYQKGILTILNRIGLEDAACECYATVAKDYTRLLSENDAGGGSIQ